MAAWEFAAGRYPHPFATAFCLPLLGLGFIVCPRRSFSAFVLGRSSRTLYHPTHGLRQQDVLEMKLSELQSTLLPLATPSCSWSDRAAYGAWVAAGLSAMAAPLTLVAFAVLR